MKLKSILNGLFFITFMISTQAYAEMGSHTPEKHSTQQGVYYPSDISTSNPTPVVFFLQGGFSNNYRTSYDKLLKFVASHGYTVVFTSKSLNDIDAFMEEEAAYLDTSKIGIIGHSVGGGGAFKTLLDAKKRGWGNEGRFIFSIEPWLTDTVTASEIRNLPSNTNFVIQQYGLGGNNSGNDVSSKTPLTQYYLLDSIPNKNKDYQVFNEEGITHSYPRNEVNEMPYLVNSLEALMKYTFTGSNNESLRVEALEIGTDDPYTKYEQILNSGTCKGSDNYPRYNTINHCINFMPTLISGNEVSRNINLGDMIYYKISAKNGQTITTVLNELSADADLYIKKGLPPTRADNDYKSTKGNINNDEIEFTVNEDTDIYIGVYGYKAADYSLTSTVTGGNGNNAHLTLNAGVDTFGIADKHTYKYYKIDASAGDSVTVNLHDMDADGNLYVNVGSEASISTYDCSSENSNTNADTCTVTLSQDDTVYIAVYAANCINNVEHKVKASIISGNGNNAHLTLNAGVDTFDIADKHTYKYYKIDASAGDSVTVNLHDMDADGNLYVNVGSEASISTYDCSSENSNTNADTCTVTLSQDDTIYIAVYAANCINNVEHKVKASIQ